MAKGIMGGIAGAGLMRMLGGSGHHHGGRLFGAPHMGSYFGGGPVFGGGYGGDVGEVYEDAYEDAYEDIGGGYEE